MGKPLTGLETLDGAWQEPVRTLSKRLADLWGDRLLGLVVYGPAVDGLQSTERRLLRSAAVLQLVDLTLLRQLAEDGARLGQLGLARPQLFTPEYLQDSCDTFPLELIEIKQQHVTVLGADYFESLTFADADVRLQCEREFKVILIGMHQALLASAGQEKNLLELTGPLLEHLVRTMRGLLWLKGQREPRSTQQVVESTERLLGHPLAGVRNLVQGTNSTTWDAFCEVYANVQHLGQYVNA